MLQESRDLFMDSTNILVCYIEDVYQDKEPSDLANIYLLNQFPPSVYSVVKTRDYYQQILIESKLL